MNIERIKSNVKGIRNILKGSIIEAEDYDLIIDRLNNILFHINISQKNYVIDDIISESEANGVCCDNPIRAWNGKFERTDCNNCGAKDI